MLGYLDHRRAIPGLVVGILVGYVVASGALVLLYALRTREALATKTALGVVVGSATGLFFVIAVVLLYGQPVWISWWPSLSDSIWWERVFFSFRFAAYFIALVVAYTTLRKKKQAPERLLLVPVMMVLVSYDIIVGLHAPAKFWVGTFVALPLLALGVAAAAGLGAVVSRLLLRTETVVDSAHDEHLRWLRRCILLASLASLALLGAAVGVFASVGDVADWKVHAHGVWKIWLGVGGGLLVLACIASLQPATPGRVAGSGILALLALAVITFVAILPMTAHSESFGIGGYALGGFAGGIAGPLFAAIAVLNRLVEKPKS
ncbi:MAG: hypothetical protein ACKV2T_07035 [Kofleriaceae bacterium]